MSPAAPAGAAERASASPNGALPQRGRGAGRLVVFVLLAASILALEFGLEVVLPDSSWRQLILFAMINVIVALSLNIINGMAGQFSIGQAGFVGIGAYTAAIVVANLHVALGEPEITFARSLIMVPLGVAAGSVTAALFGLLVGLPSLRLRGDYLAIVTLGFAEIFRLIIATAQLADADKGGLSGAIASLGGQNGYAGPRDLGIPAYAGPFWIAGAMVLSVLLCWRLKFSGWGRALRALREDEIAAEAVGVDPTRYKVTSFVLAAAGAGVAGALLSMMRDGSPMVQPDQFNFQYSFDAITMVILGGAGSVTGAVFGGVFVTVTVKMIELLQGLESVQALRAEFPGLDLNALRMVIYAGVLISIMILRPEGLFGERELVRRRRPSLRGPGEGGPRGAVGEPAAAAAPEGLR